MLYSSTPGVGEYNLDESIDSSSAYKRVPKFSFGNQMRKTVEIKDGPSPLDYRPKKNLVRAPVAAIPKAGRFGSAGIKRSINEDLHVVQRK